MTGKRQIKFGQINLHKCKAAAAELDQRGYYDITLITEPYSTRGRVRLEENMEQLLLQILRKSQSSQGHV